MKFKVVHETPNRMRVKLLIPKGYSFDTGMFMAFEGVRHVSFNCKTGCILINYNGRSSTKANLLRAIEQIPLSSFKRVCSLALKTSHESDLLKKKKNSVIRSGAMLFLSPLIPLSFKFWLSLYGAVPFFKRAFKALLNLRLNTDLLDGTVIGVAIFIKDYKTAGIISFLLNLGSYIEQWTEQRSGKMLTEAFQFSDEYVWMRREGVEQKVKISELKEGDLVVVRAGSRIPVDGIVVEGEAIVNQSFLTGEPLGVQKREGVMCYTGTVVEEGRLVIKALAIGSNTRVAMIVRLIQESEHLKAEVESHAEKLANRIVPFTFFMTGLAYLLSQNPIRALSVLLIDYSCAIKLSTSIAIKSGILLALKKGILIKGGKFIERLAKADTFVFDKTGTLTKATPRVVDIIPFNGYNRDEVLKITACVEEHFPHPIATAVVKRAEQEGLIHKEEHSEVEHLVAHGIVSSIEGKRIVVGSRHFVIEHEGIDESIAKDTIERLSSKGYSILYVAIDHKLSGLIVIEDPLREEAVDFIEKLKTIGAKRILMLTGDSETSARKAAKQLGIYEYYSEMLPDQKTEVIKTLNSSKYRIVMVGDGINDSPALTYADVGISMKHGAEIAQEASDVLLLKGNLMNVIEAKKISETVMATINKNFKFIFSVNSSLILLSLLGLSAPIFSALMHNTSTVVTALMSFMISHEKK